MNQDQIKFMTEAIKLAEENIKSGKGGPFGAVVVKNGKIIARGSNHVTSDNDPTAHAEVVAIREACKVLDNFQLDDCEIYSSCEPCPMCLGAIYWARPAALYFAAGRLDAAEAGFDDNFIYREISTQINERKINTNQMLREEALEVFEIWKKTEKKTPY